MTQHESILKHCLNVVSKSQLLDGGITAETY